MRVFIDEGTSDVIVVWMCGRDREGGDECVVLFSCMQNRRKE